MGRYLTKMVLLVLTPILLFLLLIPFSSGASNENKVCISKGGRFPPYESEGKPPKSAYLNMCKVFSGKTCCSDSQMQSASLALKSLATYGEATKDCLDVFQILECSICNSKVGIRSGPPRICASFCDEVFEACSDAYLSSNASKQVIVPCGANEDTICGKASQWVSNGTAFCNAAGFTVQTADNSKEEPCFGSSAMIESLTDFIFEMIFRELSVLGGVLLLNWLDKWEERRARIRRQARERLERE